MVPAAAAAAPLRARSSRSRGRPRDRIALYKESHEAPGFPSTGTRINLFGTERSRGDAGMRGGKGNSRLRGRARVWGSEPPGKRGRGWGQRWHQRGPRGGGHGAGGMGHLWGFRILQEPNWGALGFGRPWRAQGRAGGWAELELERNERRGGDSREGQRGGGVLLRSTGPFPRSWNECGC